MRDLWELGLQIWFFYLFQDKLVHPVHSVNIVDIDYVPDIVSKALGIEN